MNTTFTVLNRSTRLLLAALLAILVLPFSAQPAHAATITISDEASCEATGGRINISGTECRFDRTYTVNAGDTLQLNMVTEFSSNLTNNGTVNINTVGGGTITNNGTINLTTRGQFRVRDTLHNTSTGVINLHSGGWLYLFSLTVLNNEGVIIINSGGRLSNDGAVNNQHKIEVRCGGSLEGSGTYTGNPLQVSDCTPPTITQDVSGTLGNNAWYMSDVSITWNVVEDESDISSQTDCDPITVNTDTAELTLTCTATSEGGTSSRSVTFKRDATPPALNPTVLPNPVPLGGSATVTSNAFDALSGLASESCGTLDTSTAGIKSVTCTATDNAGNTATATISYQVAYSFAGFFSPVDNLPMLNTVKAGQAIPVKFSLGGDQGLDLFAPGYPKVQQIACDSSVPGDAIEETVTAGSSGLQYDPATQTYTYVWKTQKSWAGSCRQLVLRLADGTDHIANFKFK
jgi:hypothetical protein